MADIRRGSPNVGGDGGSRMLRYGMMEPADEIRTFQCPHCGASGEAPFGASPVQCAHCRESVEIIDSVSNDPFAIVDDSEPVKETPEDVLDRKRIAKVTRAKVSTMRSRRTAIIWGVVCAFGAVMFAKTAYQSAPFSNRYPILLGTIALFCAYHAFDCWKQFTALSAELKATPPEEPLPEPDFSRLSDGSQQVRNLEDVK